jgi:hypothetical protein
MSEPICDRYPKALRAAAVATKTVGIVYILQAAGYMAWIMIPAFGGTVSRQWGNVLAGPFAAIYGMGLVWMGLHLTEHDNLRGTLILLALIVHGPILLAIFLCFTTVQTGAAVLLAVCLLALLHVAALGVVIWAYRLQKRIAKQGSPQNS